MLLSSLTLSVYNNNLTTDTVKWVLRNVPSMDPNTLYQLKAEANADNPLMKEESLYDDLPVEVQAAFVMEPYFPRKHFDRAFAWLFGKQSIAQIDADDFAHYEALADTNTNYSLRDFWQHLPFTREEYCHIFNEFNKLTSLNDGYQFISCRRGLLKHACITPEIYSQEISARTTAPHVDVCSEVASLFADKRIAALKSSKDRRSNKNDPADLNAISDLLCLENLPQERRDEVLSMFNTREIGLYGIKTIYDGNIPDTVFYNMMKSGEINAGSAIYDPSILMDLRLPEKEATNIAFLYPVECALYYLGRSDINQDTREQFLLKMIEKLRFDGLYIESNMPRVMERLVLDGVLTAPEISLIKDDFKGVLKNHIFEWAVNAGVKLTPAEQDEWIGKEFSARIQLQHYHDVPILIDAIRFYYTQKSVLGDGQSKRMRIDSFFNVLLNPGWTRELLLELIDVTRQKPVKSHLTHQQDSFRAEIFCKLFSESFYPSLDKEDLTGPYGRAENLLARLLDGDANWLSNVDIDLIVKSPIRLDYVDSEVDLAASLARNPDINERIVAERLRLRVEQAGQSPTLTRQCRAI